MSSWTHHKLSDLAVVNEKNIDKAYPYDEIEYIDIASVDKGRILETRKLSRKEAPSRAQRIVKDNDILLSTVRPNLKHFAFVKKANPNTIASTGFAVISARKIDPYFLYYYLSTDRYTDFLTAIADAHTSTYPAFNPDILENSEVPSPPEADQRRIGKILADLDAKIELNQQMNKTLEAMAQAFFKEWFMSGTAGGDVVSVGELIEFDPTMPVKKGAILPYVDMGELSTDGMTIGSIILKSFAGGSRFQNGDTLLARITPCLENGKTAFVGFLEDLQIGFGSTEFIVMRAKTGSSPQFVYCLARDPGFRSFAIQSMVGSSGRQRVQRNMLESYEIVRPAGALMEKFQEITEPLFQRVSENCCEIRTLSQIRDLILPRLMSGKIRVEEN